MIKHVKTGLVKKIICLALLSAAFFAAVPVKQALAVPAAVRNLAVVNVGQVIAECNPGKEGQKYIDTLRADLNKELETFKKSVEKDKKANDKIAQKQAELNGYFRAEMQRVTNLISNAISKNVAEWLDKNNQGIIAVAPVASLMAFKTDIDITAEITRRMNIVRINFAEGKLNRQGSPQK